MEMHSVLEVEMVKEYAHSGIGFVVKIGNNFYLRGIVSASLGDSILGCDVDY